MDSNLIELTEHQMLSLTKRDSAPPRMVNPHTQETFVLLSVAEFESLREKGYDDSPWTREELETQALNIAERSEWEEYDDVSETP